MEKVEKNLIPNHRNGRNLIKASTILEITLEDYHESRKLYGQNSTTNFEGSNIKNMNIDSKSVFLTYLTIRNETQKKITSSMITRKKT